MVPARAGLIPISRAPVRFSAVARSALPTSVKSKNRNSRPLNTSAAARISTVCPETCTPAISIAIDVSGSVRTPSGPKNSRPSPTSAKCSATETVSNNRTEASAIGRNTIRSSSGEIGMIRSSASTIRTGIGGLKRIVSQTIPTTIKGSTR